MSPASSGLKRSASGRTGIHDEESKARWTNSLWHYYVGYGIRRADDLAAVAAFFEAFNGHVHGFRDKNWVDAKFCVPSQAMAQTDQPIGTGDDAVPTFNLLNRYSSGARRRTRATAVALPL